MPAPELLALTWRKSSASDRDDCVEVAIAGRMTIIRDSKDPQGGYLLISSREWGMFVLGVRKRAPKPALADCDDLA